MNTIEEIIKAIKETFPKAIPESHPSHSQQPQMIVDSVIKVLTTYSNKIETFNDGYHSFNDLYEFRKMYNAVLFNEWARQDHLNPNWKENDTEPLKIPKYNVHKSKRHYDGEECFGGGWFIVVAILPTGQISNHYELKDWDLFQIPEKQKALFPFDNHTSEDVINRLKDLTEIHKGASLSNK